MLACVEGECVCVHKGGGVVCAGAVRVHSDGNASWQNDHTLLPTAPRSPPPPSPPKEGRAPHICQSLFPVGNNVPFAPPPPPPRPPPSPTVPPNIMSGVVPALNH